VPQGQGSGSNDKRDVEPSIATSSVEDPSRSFVPKVPYPERLERA
jgi:hypothetical protein